MDQIQFKKSLENLAPPGFSPREGHEVDKDSIIILIFLGSILGSTAICPFSQTEQKDDTVKGSLMMSQ